MPEPDDKRIDKLVGNKKQIEKLRRRLSDISWFMGILLENIARRANFDDDCAGRFWETRFKCREITDASGLLLCGIYVDLNPIRAGEADSPETARYTSLFQRLEAQSQRKNARDRADGWMAELTLRPERKTDEALCYASRSGRRASDLGVLPISLEDYLKLFRWTARLLKSGQRSTIPKDLESVLDRLDVNHEKWLDTVDSYERSFCHAVGSPESLAKVAQRMEAEPSERRRCRPRPLHLARSLLTAASLPRGVDRVCARRARGPQQLACQRNARSAFRSRNHRQGPFFECSRRLRNDVRTHQTAPTTTPKPECLPVSACFQQDLQTPPVCANWRANRL